MKIKEVIDLHYSEFIIIVDEIDEEEIKIIEKRLKKPKQIYWKVQ
jgi:hypothetical protein